MRHHLPWPQNDITATCDGLPIQETLDFWLFLSATLENVTECDLNTLQDEWLLTWQALKQNTTRAYFWIKKNLTCSFPPGLMCWFDGYKLGHLWQQLQKKNFISFGFCCSISRSRCRTRANVNRFPPLNCWLVNTGPKEAGDGERFEYRQLAGFSRNSDKGPVLLISQLGRRQVIYVYQIQSSDFPNKKNAL